MKVSDFIDGPVSYDQRRGQGLFVNANDDSEKLIAVFASFPLFLKTPGVNYGQAQKFQDKIGDFVAEAINEKIERERES